MTIWRMRVACWIRNSTNTSSEYVTLIAFPQQQWLHDRTSLLRCTYIACLVYRKFPESQHYQGEAYFAIESRMFQHAPCHTDCSPVSVRSVRFSLQPLHTHPSPTTYHIPLWRAVTNLCAIVCVSEKRRILLTVDRCLTRPNLFLTNSCITA